MFTLCAHHTSIALLKWINVTHVRRELVMVFSIFGMNCVVNPLFGIWFFLHMQLKDWRINIIPPKLPLKKFCDFNIFIVQPFLSTLLSILIILLLQIFPNNFRIVKSSDFPISASSLRSTGTVSLIW